MPSPSSLLLALLLTALQLALSVDAKGGGKGSKGSKSSKKKSKTKTKVPPVEYYRANGKCYNNQHVEIRCPARKKTALIVGIVIAVIAVILILAVAIWFFKRRSKKNKKSLDVKSRGIDDASSDYESIVPLVRAETKDSGYSYTDKSMHV